MSLLKSVFNRKEMNRPPMWLMRQAGRYLPEYRKVREQAGSFLNLCYNPDLAAEVTLQPIRRFDFDIAILFADILVIPDALGIDVQFKQGEGPVLEKLPIQDGEEAIKQALQNLKANMHKIDTHLNPIIQTVEKVRKKLDDDKALMGFCGAPWTVALYMLDNKPSKESVIARQFAYQYPDLFDELMDILVEASVQYLSNQIEAGADAVQIFDSWASQVPHALFEKVLKRPLLNMAKGIKKHHPDTPIILFPRGLSQDKLIELANEAEGKFDGLSLDYTVDLAWAVENLQDKVVIQGNLDPAVMLSTPEAVEREALKVLNIATKKPGYIFNFGHGILPTVPVENVERLAKTVQNFTKES